MNSLLTRRSFLAAAAAPASPPRPHLVLFLSDDHGWRDSSVFGSRAVRTPSLDRLAAEGTVFEQAYTGAAICIPSRAILASGLCSHRNGATANGKQMNASVKTIATYLSEAGYRVAHFGKSHFLPRESYLDWEWVPSETKGAGPLNVDLDTAAVDRWLGAQSSAGGKPLCLIVCSHSPHVYWEENQGYDPGRAELPPTFVDTPETRAWRCRYYTDIGKFDRQLGEVHSSVRRRLGANALFLYTSDNGAQWPFAKWNLYDAGIRMPMIASWPGQVKARARTRAMLHFTDVLPTFLELAGAKPPEDIDGRSFAAVLRGRTRRHRDEIFAQHTADDNGHMNCYPMRAVRTERFKYIRNLRPDLAFRTHFDRGKDVDGKTVWDSWVERAKTDPQARAIVRRYHQRPAEELYDLAADPHETRNLAADPAHAKTLDDLRGRVTKWLDSMGDTGELFGVPRPLAQENLPL
jgi:arylsulfatase A-like enzyme